MSKNLRTIGQVALITFLSCLAVQPVFCEPLKATIEPKTQAHKDQAIQLLEQGTQLYLKKQYPEAIAVWQKSLELFRAIKSPIDESKLLGNIGLAHNYLVQGG